MTDWRILALLVLVAILAGGNSAFALHWTAYFALRLATLAEWIAGCAGRRASHLEELRRMRGPR